MKKITLFEEVSLPADDANDIGVIESVNAELILQKVDKFENKYTSWINGKLIKKTIF